MLSTVFVDAICVSSQSSSVYFSWSLDRYSWRRLMAYYRFVNNATFFLRHATLSKMVALSMDALELMVLACCSWLLFLAGCSCVFLGLLACRGPLVFCSLSPIQSLKTISVFLPFRFLTFRYLPFRFLTFRFLTFRFLTLHVFLRHTFSYVTRFLTLCRLGVHHAFPWAPHVCCPSCLLHSATHSRRNHHC